MEEQIKALIEKYEGRIKSHRKNVHHHASTGKYTGIVKNDMKAAVYNKVIADLKQLLTTSEGL